MIGKLKTVVLDAPDFVALSAFYTSLAGWEQTYASDDWITLTTVDGWRIGLQDAPDHVAPRWPDESHPQQAHLDLRVPDLAEATSRAVELGARVLRESDGWTTLADPAGHPFDLVSSPESSHLTVAGVMLDVPDAKAASTFYAELTGKPVTYEGEGMAMVGIDGEQPILIQQVDNFVAPRWPDPAHPQQVHLDIQVDDINEAEPKVLALGAVRLPGEGENWRVFADPAGKPFCLIWDDEQE